MKKKILVMLCLLMTMSVFAQTTSDESIIKDEKNSKSSETLLGFNSDNEGIYFTVESNGCTSKKSFEVAVDLNCKTPSIEIYRIAEDYCKMAPFSLKIMYTWKELNIEKVPKFKVLNLFEKNIYAEDEAAKAKYIKDAKD